MPAVKNQHGLARTIPEQVKRAVRQRDGFGCIICGKAIFEYEHFDPEFCDASEHDADGIVLLCIEHHGLKTRGILSRETIASHIRNPHCRKIGFSFGAFDIGSMHPEISMGGMTCTDTRCLINLYGDEIFSIAPPIEEGMPFRISAELKDSDGKTVLKIVENEWRSESSNWDVDARGAVITIRNAPRQIVLMLRSEPPKRIIVERLQMTHRGCRIHCSQEEGLIITDPNGTSFGAISTSFNGFDTAVSFTENGMTFGLAPPVHSAWPGARMPSTPQKPSRNSRCDCGSGLRFKHCHGNLFT